MLTPDNSESSLERLISTLSGIPKRPAISEPSPKFFAPVRALSVREAVLSPFDFVAAELALGKILAAPGVACPPAVPILVPGEIIDENAILAFKYYGINEIPVVSEA